MKRLYLLLAAIGLILPYYFFTSFVSANGLNLGLFFSQLFANSISTFFAVDLVISAIVFWAFVLRESREYQMRHQWVYVVATLLAGLSFALPLFLYFRERARESLS